MQILALDLLVLITQTLTDNFKLKIQETNLQMILWQALLKIMLNLLYTRLMVTIPKLQQMSLLAISRSKDVRVQVVSTKEDYHLLKV
jgi:hypothetical protein